MSRRRGGIACVAPATLAVLVAACGAEPGRSAVAEGPAAEEPAAEGPAAEGPHEADPGTSSADRTEPRVAALAEPPSSADVAAASAEPPAPAHASCAATQPAREVPLYRPGASVEVDGRTFLYAWHRDGLEEPMAVLLSLDAAGALVETRLGAGYPDPIAIAARAHGIVVVSSPSSGAPQLQLLDVADDGRVTPGPARTIDGLDRGWPGALAAGDEEALLIARVAGPDGSGDPSGFFVLDLEHARVTRREISTRAVDVACVGATCALARLDATGLEVARVALDGSEHESRRRPVNRACRELERMEVRGQVAWLVRAAPPVGMLVRGSGLADLDVSRVPEEAACGETMYPFDHGPWPALALRYRGARPVLAWDPASEIVRPLGELEADAWERHEARAFVDGAVEVAFTASAGMMHSPTDADGRRRYFEHHSFEGGEVALWQREGGAWHRRDVRPLPVSGVEGTMSHGYAPHVLRHGAHAVVALLSEGGGDTGWLVPYRVPCPSSRDSAGPR